MNISVPDALAEEVRQRNVPVSAVYLLPGSIRPQTRPEEQASDRD